MLYSPRAYNKSRRRERICFFLFFKSHDSCSSPSVCLSWNKKSIRERDEEGKEGNHHREEEHQKDDDDDERKEEEEEEEDGVWFEEKLNKILRLFRGGIERVRESFTKRRAGQEYREIRREDVRRGEGGRRRGRRRRKENHEKEPKVITLLLPRRSRL